MKHIKNAYNAVVNFLAKWLAKGANKIAVLTAPLVTSVWGWPGSPELSTSVVMNFLLGVGLYFAGVILAAYLSILLMTGLTLLLALVLPVLAANLIALGLTVALIFVVANRAEAFA